MDGYCVFKEVSGAEIAVNARQVSYVRSTDGKTCAVYFSNNDHVVTAEESLSNILAALHNAVPVWLV
jgi:hypothetical protein